ncbi:spore protease YyaC [Paenibacillus sp. IB182496]|uniref:Spore protease YyaC n=2 Tax=Paenibacillus sabuli TaxID=2772509 RepID=A0A927BQI9_9BACL|nr:spore protease YyaC [Paenibacillus sabuli]
MDIRPWLRPALSGKELVRHDALQQRRTDEQGLRQFLQQIAKSHPAPESVAFLCIGTDRSTGDALGPLTGDLLRRQGWARVHGTLEAPCDASRLGEVVESLRSEHTVIAIDACLGLARSVGAYLVDEGPLAPAMALGTSLPPVGHYSIAGVVGVLGPRPYASLQSASLHRVMQMAAAIADSIEQAWAPEEPASSHTATYPGGDRE